MVIDSDYFFNPIRCDLMMVQGDTMSFGFELQGLKGERPQAVYFSCKEKIEDEDYLFQVTLSDNIDLRSYDEARDILTYGVRIPPYLTQYIPLGRYYYDLQVRVNFDTITLMIGRLDIQYQVTMATAPTPPIITNADLVEYPKAITDPSAERKYTEKFINDIAIGLNYINGNHDQELETLFTVGYDESQVNQMSYYLINTIYTALIGVNNKINDKLGYSLGYQGIDALTTRINLYLETIKRNADNLAFPLSAATYPPEVLKITCTYLNDIANELIYIYMATSGTRYSPSEMVTEIHLVFTLLRGLNNFVNTTLGESLQYSGIEDLVTRITTYLDKKYPNGTEVYY